MCVLFHNGKDPAGGIILIKLISCQLWGRSRHARALSQREGPSMRCKFDKVDLLSILEAVQACACFITTARTLQEV